MDKYKLQAIDTLLTVVLVLGIIVGSALFSWWLLLLLLGVSQSDYIGDEK